MFSTASTLQLSGLQQFAVAILRIAIGWHFLREGWVKLSLPTWTAEGYLYASKGPFRELMLYFANDPNWMAFINVFIPWALFLSGLGLMLGLFTRISCLLGISLLAMFYIAMPPWDYTVTQAAMESTMDWATFSSNMGQAQWAGNQMYGNEGNYIIVNKNLVELLAVGALLTLQAGRYYGIDAVINQWFSGSGSSQENVESAA
mgnify:CR=1 FL=1